MKARISSVEATTTTAHKMARAICHMMLRKEDFKELVADHTPFCSRCMVSQTKLLSETE